MIKIEIAALPIGLDNKYPHVELLSRDYITEREPLFTVSASPEEMKREAELVLGEFSDGYVESTVLFRNIAEQLPRYGAFVFHGAVIAYEGGAYAITARSGVGKTTHLSLWLRAFGDKVHILNGDKPVLRVIDGKVYACATPWRGKEGFGVNEMLPLRGIAFLKRAEKNSAVPITANDALMDFVTQMYIPKSQDTAPLALSLADKVISGVPLYSLHANMNIDAAHVALSAFTKNNIYGVSYGKHE